jgi:hypothetical protein
MKGIKPKGITKYRTPWLIGPIYMIRKVRKDSYSKLLLDGKACLQGNEQFATGKIFTK